MVGLCEGGGGGVGVVREERREAEKLGCDEENEKYCENGEREEGFLLMIEMKKGMTRRGQWGEGEPIVMMGVVRT